QAEADEYQLILVHTPGLHRPRTLLGQRLNDLLRETLLQVDAISFWLHAESSASSAELDSLLAPVNTLKKAQLLAARAFGAKRTYFVTIGTSTANKVVHQAVVAPDEVVMVDRNCHKSHHHALMLTGARTAYLEA